MNAPRELQFDELEIKIIAANIRITRYLEGLINKGIAKYKISKAQFDVLAFINFSEDKYTTVTELAIIHLVSKANITGIVNRLIKIDLIQKVTDTKDARSNVLTLTEKGAALINELMPIYLQISKDAVSIFSLEEKNKLQDQLKHIEDFMRSKI